MSNVLEFYIKMKDFMSSPLVKMAKTAKDTFAKIGTYNDQVKKKNDILGSSYSELKRKIELTEKSIAKSNIPSEIKAARRELELLQRQANNHVGNTNKTGGGLGSLIGAGAIGYGAKELLSQSLQQAAAKENALISYKVLTGSKAFGDRLYNNIVKMADSTPFESQDLTRSSKTLLGYGVNKKQIMPNLQMFGDIASAQDNPAEALQSISLAFGQIYAKGHLAGQEVLQLVNAGFNPLKEISEMTGRSMNDLEKAMSKGEITVNMVQKAFAHATGEGGKFHNMMQEQSQTLGGKYSTMLDLWHSKLRAVGTFLSPLAKGVMSLGSSLLNNKIAIGLMVAVLGILSFAVIKAAFSVGTLKTAMDSLKSSFTTGVGGGLNALGWVGVITSAIALLLPLFDKLFEKVHGINDEFMNTYSIANFMKDIKILSAEMSGEKLAPAQKLYNYAKLNTGEEAQKYLDKLKDIDPIFKTLKLSDIGGTTGEKAMQDFTAKVKQATDALAAEEKVAPLMTDIQKQKDKIDATADSMTNGTKPSIFNIPKYIHTGHGRYEELGGYNQKYADSIKLYIETNKKQIDSVGNKTIADVSKISKSANKNSIYLKDKKQDATINTETEKVGKSVASGGPRVINIHGVKFTDKIEMHVANAVDGINDLQTQLEDMFLRILNSGATVSNA
jgi:tape measure domain-containing protein